MYIYKKEKSLKMKRDVGMACQKVHKQGRIKVMVNIQSLIHPYIFSQKSKGCRDEAYNMEFVLSIALCIILRPGTRQRLATSINLRTDSCSHSCGLVLSQTAVICGLGMRLTVCMHT